MNFYSSIVDNYNHGSVGDFLKKAVLEGSDLSIVSAYFTIYAYEHLKDKLDNINKLQFLFGEPRFLQSLDPNKANFKEFKIEDDGIAIPTERRLEQSAIARECSKWIEEKVEIRSIKKPNFLHGKLYHIKQPSGIEKAIVGSSNFTVSGLGLSNSKNIELNVIVDSDRDRQDLKNWFDTVWNDTDGLVEDVKQKVLDYLKQLYIENPPEFIYFKTIYHIFEDYLNDRDNPGLILNEKTGFYDSQIWNALYDFQKDGVKGAINKILKYNGCIIADSVGLGKTYEALAVIKYFELLNARVLVLCPKNLSNNWTIYQAGQNHEHNPFKKDRFGYSVLYHTDLGRESGRSSANSIDLENFNWGAYDLVVIDESHNFKANPAEKTTENNTKKMNRTKWLMEKIIKSGTKTRVLMLSATPVNNELKDLRNQIAFITEGKNDALKETTGIKDIAQTLKNAQTEFTNWAKKPQRNVRTLLEELDPSFFKLLDALTIARSRKHILKFYDVSSVGSFPKREKPISVYPKIDTLERFPSYDEINKQIEKYRLSIFNPMAYVKEDKRSKYEVEKIPNFTQEERENFLIGMMKVNYLKRLESSINSFNLSIQRTIDKITELEEKIEKFINNQPTQDEIEEEILTDNTDNEEDEDLDEVVGKKLKFSLKDLELEKWLKDLQQDKDNLSRLLNIAKEVNADRDAKLQKLKDIIKKKIEHPINDLNKKVLIFTAFSDTAEYLYDNLKDWVTSELNLHCALVTGSKTDATFGKKDYNSILTNFSPISKNRAQLSDEKEEIDILIATDCISEGQNLQDCDCLINYDIHWNPVRIIQRFGRIDRIGSKNKVVQMINFWPTKDLDNYINLKTRVESKMALVDLTATGEENVLNAEQIEEFIIEDLKYRTKQLKKLQKEVLDIEELDGSVSLTDFTLDDFRVELLNYINKNEQKLKNSPLGLYAVVPTNVPNLTESEQEIIKPGVIFCLSQKNPSEENGVFNPLNPYFLVYIRNDYTVRYNYTNPKQILEIFRALCQGKTEPYHELCDVFNKETENGYKMEVYSKLLEKAVSEITNTFKKRVFNAITMDRNAKIPLLKNQLEEINDFDLVTWLILR